MNLYLVRHAESELNNLPIHQGDNTPLSKQGLKQARIIAKRLKDLNVDFFYASKYKRAQQTAEIIAKSIGKQIKYLKDLHEVDNPSEIVNLNYDDPESKRIKSLIKENFTKGDWKYSDEESFNEMKERANRVLNLLFEKHKKQNVLCITHGIFIKMLTCHIVFGETLSPEIFWEFRNHTWTINTGITRIEYTDKFGWTLVTWNDTTHM